MAEHTAIFEPAEGKIGKQIVLPITKALEISLKSLRIRFWRSMITMSGIILAIAFLTFVWVSNEMEKAMRNVPQDAPEYSKLEEYAVKKGLDLEGGGGEGPGATSTWVISLALGICVVGIVNAMLMSVTERIHSFIIKLFMLESSLQGAVGTLLGIVLGGSLAFLGALMSFRIFAIRYFPGGGVLKVLILAFVIGAALSVFAAIFPAYRAARMQPVDAMRVEE